jgi:hypothetical protein
MEILSSLCSFITQYYIRIFIYKKQWNWRFCFDFSAVLLTWKYGFTCTVILCDCSMQQLQYLILSLLHWCFHMLGSIVDRCIVFCVHCSDWCGISHSMSDSAGSCIVVREAIIFILWWAVNAYRVEMKLVEYVIQ